MPDDADETRQELGPGGVFISHIHEDRAIANAFSILVRDVTAGTVPTFASSSTAPEEGIKYGDEWFQWIREKVESADHVVALLTPRSVEKPWILFEAGLGKAQPDSSMFGVAVGMSVAAASVGPFGVFQNSSAERASLIKLCGQLIAPSKLKPRAEIVEMMVDQFILAVQSAVPDQESVVEDPKSAALFQAIEDLKFLVREQRAGGADRSSHRVDRHWEFTVPMLLEDSNISVSSRRRLLAIAADQLINPVVGFLVGELASAPSRSVREMDAQLYVLDRILSDAKMSATNDWVFYFIRREMAAARGQAEEIEARRNRIRERDRERHRQRLEGLDDPAAGSERSVDGSDLPDDD